MLNTHLYNHILHNIDIIQLDSVLLDLELYSDAVFLKHKFDDKRTILQLVKLIKEEYKIA